MICLGFFFALLLVLILNVVFRFAGHLFRKTVADSNAPVQEKALDALIAFLRAADSDAGRYGVVYF